MIGVGDLVVCVDARINPALGAISLVEGRIYRVIGVRLDGPLPHQLYGRSYGIAVAGAVARGTGYFATDRFRKVEHDKREACEAEFVTLINRTRAPVECVTPHNTTQGKANG